MKRLRSQNVKDQNDITETTQIELIPGAKNGAPKTGSESVKQEKRITPKTQSTKGLSGKQINLNEEAFQSMNLLNESSELLMNQMNEVANANAVQEYQTQQKIYNLVALAKGLASTVQTKVNIIKAVDQVIKSK